MKAIIKPEKLAGEWGVSFTIGSQTFQVRTFSDNKEETRFHIKMLRIAFKNLTKTKK